MYECTYVRSMFGFGAHACAPISHLQWHLTVIIMKFIYDFGFLFTFPALSISLWCFLFISFCCLLFVVCLLLLVCFFILLLLCDSWDLLRAALKCFVCPIYATKLKLHTQLSHRSLPAVAFRRRIPCGIRSAECSNCLPASGRKRFIINDLERESIIDTCR